MAKGVLEDASEVVIDCRRGIPFRLRLTDESGADVDDAEVQYMPVSPNPALAELLPEFYSGYPLSLAARRAQGDYEGFVLPGPGAVLIKTAHPDRYRPAHVDPKRSFAPGKTDWTAQELISAYGTHETLANPYGQVDQHDYAAIALVNPPASSRPLELTATLVRDRPRQVTILDWRGKPLVGVKTQGLTANPWDAERPLRASTIPITGLHPDRSRRITFVKEDRKLIAFLMARGDGESPSTVRLRPWATIIGRIVDPQGRPQNGAGGAVGKAALTTGTRLRFATHDDSRAGQFPDLNVDFNGRFRLERLVPGQRYTAEVYVGPGMFVGKAFEDLILLPGEVRDLGDLRTKAPVDLRGR